MVMFRWRCMYAWGRSGNIVGTVEQHMLVASVMPQMRQVYQDTWSNGWFSQNIACSDIMADEVGG
jgi:hypothetical protein